MNIKTPYLVYLSAACLFLHGCDSAVPAKRIPKLTETYYASDKKPFGAYIAYHQLGEMFFHNSIHTESRNFEESWKNIDDTSGVYITIAKTLYTTNEDVNSIIAFAERGNDAFFSAQSFDHNLLDELGCKVFSDLDIDILHGILYKRTGIRFNSHISTDTSMYRYYYYPFTTKFASFDPADTRVLGYSAFGAPDFIVVFRGKGRIFLHCEPRTFSNYFLLQYDNYHYLENAFGYMNDHPQHVYWNSYYARLRSKDEAMNNRNDSGGFSSLSEILKHPPLAVAFWLSLSMLLLYVLFGIKRRQRVIEMVKPNENTTVTFTETIGRLYLQKKDNKNIAEKMTTYFNEYIRNKYFLNTYLINGDFIDTLSRKSGVPHGKVESLYRAIDRIGHSMETDDFQLLSLNEQIQDFFKRIK